MFLVTPLQLFPMDFNYFRYFLGILVRFATLFISGSSYGVAARLALVLLLVGSWPHPPMLLDSEGFHVTNLC